MSELNREQIIKALECCASDGCETCPNSRMPTLANCVIFTMGNALSLIKELTEENAEVKANWQKLKESHESACEKCRAEFKRLTEENERLKSVEFICGFIKPHKVLECPIFDEIAKAKADTVSELQTRVAMRYGTYTDKDMTPIAEVFRLLDQIAKEMLECEK